MSSKSKTFKYIDSLVVQDVGHDFVVKTANSREIVSCLPSPSNLKRNLDHVPEVDVRLILSTSERLPDHISRRIATSENKGFFTHKSLLGLCTSGRGVPVEIFLHDHVLMISDPSGEVFEEVAWHELVHGIEGIECDVHGHLTRQTPWSYRLQQAMLEIDEENGHVPILPDHDRKSAHSLYLRHGTSLQDHVSEMFARIAVIFMYHIKETGGAFRSGEDLFKITSLYSSGNTRNSRKHNNISDFLNVWGTFSEEAQLFFTEELDNVIKNTARLYGCDVDG